MEYCLVVCENILDLEEKETLLLISLLTQHNLT